MSVKLFCGDALCKSPIPAAPSRAGPWPLRCASCRTALYPSDVLSTLLPNELEPKRAELMAQRGGLRVAITSAELSPAPSAPADDDVGLDRLLAMVELDPAAARARRRRTVVVVVASASIVLLALVAIFSFR